MRKVLLSMTLMFAILAVGAQGVSTNGNLKEIGVSSQTGGGLTCDSIILKDFNGVAVEKIIKEYTPNGNLAGKTKYVLNEFSSSWTPDARYIYTYDENNYQNSSVYAVWNASAKEWKNEDKVACTFNPRGKILSQNVFKWADNAWAPTFKAEATYDERDNLLSEYTMMHDATGENWLALTKNEYTYNNLNQWLLAISSTGKQNSDEFVPSFRTHYTYTESGKITLRHMEDWNMEQNKWTDTSKEIWSYDGAENEIESVSFFKDFETGELKETSKYEKQYDGKNMILDLFYNKDTEGNWRLNRKTEYTYNEKDSITEKITYIKDMMSGELLPSLKIGQAFDDKGNRISSFGYYWNNGWVNSTKEEKTYNPANQVLTLRKYFWDLNFETSEGEWKMNFKEDYAYDTNGYQTSLVSYTYDRMADTWSGQAKSEKEYDQFGNIRKDINYQWIEELEDFKLMATLEYFYSVPSSISTTSRTVISVLVHNRIIEVNSGDGTGICVFDLNGRLVSKGSKVIPVSQAGCYIITANGVLVGKVVVN